MSNPYRRVHRWTRHRSGGRWNWVLPVGATLLAVPWTESVLLGFIEQGRIHAGLSAVAFRLAVLVAGAMCLHTYTDLVRGSDRPVLDPHPVQARALIEALDHRTAIVRFYLPLMGAILLLPVGGKGTGRLRAGGSDHFWLLGRLGVGLSTHLAAVWASRSSKLTHLLDAVRGTIPPCRPRDAAPCCIWGGRACWYWRLQAWSLTAAGRWPHGWHSRGVWVPLDWLCSAFAERFYVRTTAFKD